MKLKFLKPTTPSQRHLIKLSTKHLNKKPFIKTKISGLKNSSGRNNSGKITVKGKGKGHSQKYRKINFFRTFQSTGIVSSIEYDPNRNANIASIYDYIKNKFFYIIAPKRLTIGSIIKSGPNSELYTGNSLPLFKIPEGTFIHNISPKKSKKSQLSRSAGTFSILKKKTTNYVEIELNSKERRWVPANSYATIGIVSNELYSATRLGKAGHSRWLNRRPKVRGVAMNPVDHPHGGGEGKKSGKGLTAWGKPTKRGPTTRSKNKLIIKKR